MAGRNKPVKQGLGRVIYLTLIRRMSNNQVQQTGWDTSTGINQLENGKDNITICFDPWRDESKTGKKQRGKLNTRIDFYVKHLGDAGVGNNGYYATANIDVWNIGPALEQFLSVYEAYQSEGHYKDLININKYAIILQVGFRDSAERTTVFAGHISSFVCDRQQSDSSVDNVWHFLCQYPDPQRNNETGFTKISKNLDSTTGEYKKPTWNAKMSFPTWEEYLIQTVCYMKQTVYDVVPTNVAEQSDSFEVAPIEDSTAQMSRLREDKSPLQDYTDMTKVSRDNRAIVNVPVVPSPRSAWLATKDFNKYFSIEYRVARNSAELKEVKDLWQTKKPVCSWRVNTTDLKTAINDVASGLNCHGRVELDYETGRQTIYIYPAGWQAVYKEDEQHRFPTEYLIVDYQNLRKPPQVAANMFHLDMIMEPGMRPGSIIELQVSKEFMNKYKHPTFEPAFSMGNTATVFAGANFVGLAQMSDEEKKHNAIASAGNIFNKKFVATIVEHKGSSHTAEWTTSVDCYGVVIKSKKGEEVTTA